MRPTIPLAEWRISIDLELTAELRATPGRPGVGCDCLWCQNWRAVAGQTLPHALQDQLSRVGTVLAAPSDLYAYAGGSPLFDYRVTYHCVGRILDGPPAAIPATIADGSASPQQNYRSLGAACRGPGLSVGYEREVAGRLPSWARPNLEPLIRIDFRIGVPWALTEPAPAMYSKVPTGRVTR